MHKFIWAFAVRVRSKNVCVTSRLNQDLHCLPSLLIFDWTPICNNACVQVQRWYPSQKFRLWIQYEAARIVTGLTRSVSIDKLIKEIGWWSLSNRRLFQMAVLMYKIINGLAPEYISNIMPAFVSERTEYSLRNAADISVLSRRTEIYSRSFFSSSVDYWNKLPLSVRSADSLSALKQLLKRSMFRSPEISNYFVSGQGISSVYHCRIRNNSSNLNEDS